jgi:hypothetical protein
MSKIIIMQKISLLLLCSFLAFSCSQDFFKNPETLKPSQDFAQGSEDIPLLLGMEKMQGESLGFDTAAGSIITSSYTTKNSLQKVRNFYLETLPQMGWKVLQNGENKAMFRREKEKLEIEFSKDGEKKVVTFFISSAL